MILAFCLIRKYNSSLSVWCNFFKGVAWLFGIINQRTTELPIIIRVDSLRQWDSALVSFQNQECLALVLQNHHQYWQSKFIYLLHSKSLSNNPKILNNLLNFPVHLSMYKSYVHSSQCSPKENIQTKICLLCLWARFRDGPFKMRLVGRSHLNNETINDKDGRRHSESIGWNITDLSVVIIFL